MICEKNGYSKHQIKKVRLAQYKQRTRKLRFYECKNCGKYHLTTSLDKSMAKKVSKKDIHRNSLLED